MNVAVYLISFSVCLLLLFLKSNDFYVLILYPVTLLNVLPGLADSLSALQQTVSISKIQKSKVTKDQERKQPH